MKIFYFKKILCNKSTITKVIKSNFFPVPIKKASFLIKKFIACFSCNGRKDFNYAENFKE